MHCRFFILFILFQFVQSRNFFLSDVNNDKAKKTFDGASGYCATQGGHLAVLDTTEALNEVENLIPKEQRYLHNFYLIGYRFRTFRYEWVDGSSHSTFIRWALGQPDNRYQCVTAQRKYAAKEIQMYTKLCILRFHFVCESSTSSPEYAGENDDGMLNILTTYVIPIAAPLLALLLACCVFLLCRRKKKGKDDDEESKQESTKSDKELYQNVEASKDEQKRSLLSPRGKKGKNKKRVETESEETTKYYDDGGLELEITLG